MSSRAARLSSTVHGDIIPRLVSAGFKSRDVSTIPSDTQAWCSDKSVRALTDEFLERAKTRGYKVATTVIYERVLTLIRLEVSVEQIHELLLAALARELGDRWLRDEISFVDVHLGVLQLQTVMQKIDCVAPPLKIEGVPVKAAIAATPGDQHTFGASMASNLLSQRGWETSNLSGLDLDQWLNSVLSGRFNVVCLSAHSDGAFDTLCCAIEQLKSRWKDKETTPIVIVAGDYFVRNPRTWKQAGANFASTTICETVQFVEDRLNELSGDNKASTA